jgi:hypothetical protein
MARVLENISKKGPLKPQISPLRCASVEMTKGRVVMAPSRGLGDVQTANRKPLRCAPVGMTSVEMTLPREKRFLFSNYSPG